MNIFPKIIKNQLNTCIKNLSDRKENYVMRPGKDFTRKRCLPFEKVIQFLITMSDGSLAKELLEFFNLDVKTPTTSSLIQQRNKIKPEALLHLLHDFVGTYKNIKTYKGYRLLAIDGSNINIPTNPNDTETYAVGTKNSRGYNILHINAIYDLCNKLYLDAYIQTFRKINEFKALVEMINRSSLVGKVLLVADRGYESYNNIEHLNNIGWKYLIRVKAPDVHCGLLWKRELPLNLAFDKYITVLLTRRQTNEVKSQPKLYKRLSKYSKFDFLPLESREAYPFSYRIVSIELSSGKFEYLVTNLSQEEMSGEELKEIYHKRWGIETSFRELKHTIGLTNFHSKKVDHISQEIYAKMILYCFCEMITLNVVIIQDSNKKYTYQVNFSMAITICIKFLIQTDNEPPDVEALIQKYILPIREGRNFPRNIRTQPNRGFLYRVA